jgi:hypothetical protein
MIQYSTVMWVICLYLYWRKNFHKWAVMSKTSKECRIKIRRHVLDIVFASMFLQRRVM